MTAAATPVRVAVLGAGTVGTAVVRRMHGRAEVLAHRVGAPVHLAGVAVRDLTRPRDLTGVPDGLLTDDLAALADDCDVLVEVMGGIEPARSVIDRVLRDGRHVVSANKQLLARHGPALHATAADTGALLFYEAAVVAAVPVLRVVQDALAGDEITSIHGIMNGSTNFVLDLVARQGVTVDDAVRRAGELGYLEADPTEDLEGLDAAAKIVILARCAWDADVHLEDVQREGITGLTDEDFRAARGTGGVIKLIASAWRSTSAKGSTVEVAVRPVTLAADHFLALTREGNNAIIIEAESAGTLRLHGAGAGGEETASAVLGDIVAAARSVVRAR